MSVTPNCGDQRPGPDEMREYGPFGFDGCVAGRFALRLVAELGSPSYGFTDFTAGSDNWTDSNYRAYCYAVECDSGLRLVEAVVTAPSAPVIAHIANRASAFREALPFSEGEHRWFRRRLNEHTGRLSAELLRESTHMYKDGLPVVVEAAELSRKWWAWCRDLGEFSDGAAKEAARLALVDLAAELVPDQLFPPKGDL